MRELPGRAAKPPFKVARGGREVALQSGFSQTAITSFAQAMPADQFALRSFDRVAPSIAELKGFGLLLSSPGLQVRMILPDRDCAVALVFAQTLLAQRAVMAVNAKLETVGHFSGFLLFESAALGADFSGRTERSSLLN